MLAVHVDQVDQSPRLITCNQRHIDRRFFHLRAGQDETAKGGYLGSHAFVDDHGLPGTQDMSCKSGRSQQPRIDCDSPTTFEDIRVMHHFGLGIKDPNPHVRLIEDLADLVADSVIDALHVQFGRERLLHTVDDCEFRGALLALLEQALRLVEQARIFQRHAHRVGQRLQKADVRWSERVLAVHVA